MPYQPTKPLPTDIKAASQATIAENFTVLNDTLLINHVAMNDGNQGKHIKMDFTQLAADPATAVDEIALYNKNNQLHLRYQNNGTVFNFMDALGNAIEGYHSFPNGLLIKWGSGNATGITHHPYPVGVGIPVFGLIYQVIITTDGDPASNYDKMAYLVNGITTGIDVFGSSRTVNGASATAYKYLTIGTE